MAAMIMFFAYEMGFKEQEFLRGTMGLIPK